MRYLPKLQAIIEEYGVTTNQVAVYTSWCATIVSSGLTGELFWYVMLFLLTHFIHARIFRVCKKAVMLTSNSLLDFPSRRQAGSHFTDGNTWDDGYAVYPDSTDYSTLVTCAKNIVARG